MSLNSFSIFLGGLSKSGCPHQREQHTASKQVMLWAVLSHVQRSVLTTREGQSPLAKRQSHASFSTFLFHIPCRHTQTLGFGGGCILCWAAAISFSLGQRADPNYLVLAVISKWFLTWELLLLLYCWSLVLTREQSLERKAVWVWIISTLNILLVCEERPFLPSQPRILCSFVIFKTVIIIAFPMTVTYAEHKFCCFQFRTEVLQLLMVTLSLGSFPHLISCSKWSVTFTLGNYAPGWKSTEGLISRWRNCGKWWNWFHCIWSCSEWTVCSTLDLLWTWKEEERLGGIWWGVLASTAAAGGVVWAQGMLGCFNLNLRKLEKQLRNGRVFEGYGWSWGVQNYCHAGFSVPEAHPYISSSPGDTCVLLADLGCWHLHRGVILFCIHLCPWIYPGLSIVTWRQGESKLSVL